jgi:hypothetical protein
MSKPKRTDVPHFSADHNFCRKATAKVSKRFATKPTVNCILPADTGVAGPAVRNLADEKFRVQAIYDFVAGHRDARFLAWRSATAGRVPLQYGA